MKPYSFHPAVSAWFARSFDAPTPAQERAWPEIQAGRNVLVAAPTGSGKTFAAFLAAIDELVKEGLDGALPDETRVVYVSPLKALSNDIQRNLEAPLKGIREELASLSLPDVAIRAMVRTGDTSQTDRASMRRRAPHIVVTTPESLYILLTSKSGREMLASTRSVIVDEIHAVAGNKRGAHLALSLERLQALVVGKLTRIGLSATQKPIAEIARFLVGAGGARSGDCAIVDIGHARNRDLALEIPPGFGRDLYAGRQPSVAAWLDGTEYPPCRMTREAPSRSHATIAGSSAATILVWMCGSRSGSPSRNVRVKFSTTNRRQKA